MHIQPHPLAGRTVMVAAGEFEGQQYRLEDWWDKLTGGSWGDAAGNPAAIDYAIRAALEGMPGDDEVVYGHIGSFGKLIHVSQLGEVM